MMDGCGRGRHEKEGSSATGCRGYGELEEESSEGTGLSPLARKIRQNNKMTMLMMRI